MEDVGEVLEGPEQLNDEDVAVRLRYVEGSDEYRVECSEVLQDGGLEGDWSVFGGTVGYSDSAYSSEEVARGVYDDVKDLSGEEFLDYFAVEKSGDEGSEGGRDR